MGRSSATCLHLARRCRWEQPVHGPGQGAGAAAAVQCAHAGGSAFAGVRRERTSGDGGAHSGAHSGAHGGAHGGASVASAGARDDSTLPSELRRHVDAMRTWAAAQRLQSSPAAAAAAAVHERSSVSMRLAVQLGRGSRQRAASRCVGEAMCAHARLLALAREGFCNADQEAWRRGRGNGRRRQHIMSIRGTVGCTQFSVSHCDDD